MEWTQALIPIVSSCAMTIVAMLLFVGYFQMKKQGQAIRKEEPKWYNSKAGTPTMGGLVFLIGSILTGIWVGAWQKQLTPTPSISLFILALYRVIGFLDDFVKVLKKRNMGLNSKQESVGQILGGIIFCLAYRSEGYPGVLNFSGLDLPLGITYGVFALFWFAGFLNAVNLTDGIDGLAAGLGSISFAACGLIAWYQHQHDVLIICLSVSGGLPGFFVYNGEPVKIFMGDVGSLTLGGLLAVTSIILNQEWTLLLIGSIYVMETANVMLQVTSFKLIGKRIFKMSPTHCRFEMYG